MCVGGDSGSGGDHSVGEVYGCGSGCGGGGGGGCQVMLLWLWLWSWQYGVWGDGGAGVHDGADKRHRYPDVVLCTEFDLRR